MVHRTLRELRTTRVTPDRKTALALALPEVGRHTSERERRADEAERELVQWKKVRFMADKVGEVYDGYVTGVTSFGLFVELVEHYVEGLVHISTLADDFYRFTEGSHRLVGERTQRVFQLGDHVRVQVARVDVERRLIDLAIEEVLDEVARDVRRSRQPRSTAVRKKEQRKATPEQRRRRRAARPGKRERAQRKKSR